MLVERPPLLGQWLADRALVHTGTCVCVCVYILSVVWFGYFSSGAVTVAQRRSLNLQPMKLNKSNLKQYTKWF